MFRLFRKSKGLGKDDTTQSIESIDENIPQNSENSQSENTVAATLDKTGIDDKNNKNNQDDKVDDTGGLPPELLAQDLLPTDKGAVETIDARTSAIGVDTSAPKPIKMPSLEGILPDEPDIDPQSKPAPPPASAAPTETIPTGLLGKAHSIPKSMLPPELFTPLDRTNEQEATAKPSMDEDTDPLQSTATKAINPLPSNLAKAPLAKDILPPQANTDSDKSPQAAPPRIPTGLPLGLADLPKNLLPPDLTAVQEPEPESDSAPAPRASTLLDPPEQKTTEIDQNDQANKQKPSAEQLSAVLSEMLASGALPQNVLAQILSQSMPPGAMPPGAMPPGAMPPGAMPPGAMPPGAMPPGAMPPGAMPQEAAPQETEKTEIAPNSKTTDNFEFMAPVLEALETPPAPFGRWIVFAICFFFTLAVIWAIFGKVDVVTTAQGQLVPTGKVKIVQPLETGVVKAIHVEEGEMVKKGDVLLELDTTDATANIDSIHTNLAKAKLDAAISAALLTAEKNGQDPLDFFVSPTDIDQQTVAVAKRTIASQMERYRAAIASIESEIARNTSLLQASAIEKRKLERVLPLIEEQLSTQELLFAKGAAQRSKVLELRQKLYEEQANYENLEQTNLRYQSEIDKFKSQHRETTATFRSEVNTTHSKALNEIALNEQNLKKELQRLQYRELIAPVNGAVHDLTVHTIGAVVNSAQKLMTIVPQEMPLEVESLVLNKDIGFIKVGQEAEVKLDAFPFTRHGTLEGVITAISDDVIVNEQLGPVYKMKVQMDRQTIKIEDREVRLAPGMNAAVEIKTGHRRVIEFFISPLLRYKDEAIRER